MAELSSFFDANLVNGVPDREYDATAWANYFSGFIGNGVSNGTSNLQVTAGSGLSVIVNSGIAYINGYYYNNTEPLTINLNPANATYPRVTSIVIELNLNNREITCITVDGNAQSNPTAPQLTQTPSTYQLQLATVYVPAGATNTGGITDTRSNSNVCGIMSIQAPTAPPPIIESAEITGGVVVEENGGSINYNNANGTNVINVGVTGNTFAVTNSQTNNNLLSVTPATAGVDTVNVGANINLQDVLTCEGGNAGVNFVTTDGKFNIGIGADGNQDSFLLIDNKTNTVLWQYNPISQTLTLNDPTINGANVVGELTVNSPFTIQNQSGELFFQNSQNENMVAFNPDNDTFQFKNIITGNNIFAITPVASGNDTIDAGATNINFAQNGGVNFITPTSKTSIGLCTYVTNGNEYIALYNNTDNTSLGLYNVTQQQFTTDIPISCNDLNVTENLTVTQTITAGNNLVLTETGNLQFENNNGNVQVDIGMFTDTFNVNNANTNNPLISFTPVTNGIDTLNVECNADFMQAPNLSGGLQAMGENLVNYQTFPFSVLISPGITLAGNVTFWLLNAPNLTGTTTNGATGIMTVTASVNSTYYWPMDNKFPVDLSQIPNMTAITQTPFSPFQVGTSTGTMYLKGNNQNLNAGTTYTVQALAFQ